MLHAAREYDPPPRHNTDRAHPGCLLRAGTALVVTLALALVARRR